MAETITRNENSAVIQSTSHRVRVLLNGTETMFAASDILSACGIKYPLRWMSRNRTVYPGKIQDEKLPFPMMTEYGRREIMMVFVRPEVAKDMIVMTSCKGDTKKWLLDEVLSYRIAPEKADKSTATTDTPAKMPQKSYIDTLNRRIDSILIELLELKKLAAESIVT